MVIHKLQFLFTKSTVTLFAKRPSAEFARAAGYGLYSAVSAAAAWADEVPGPYPFPWGTPLHHHHWGPSSAWSTPPSIPHSLLPSLTSPPAATSSSHWPHHSNGSSSESISPQASPIHPHLHQLNYHIHHQGLGSLPPGFSAFAAAAAAATEAGATPAPQGSTSESVQGPVSPTGPTTLNS